MIKFTKIIVFLDFIIGKNTFFQQKSRYFKCIQNRQTSVSIEKNFSLLSFDFSLFTIFDENFSNLIFVKNMTKKCPRCNDTFDCQHNANCWCSRYSLSDKLKSYLKDNYSDCICENCMKELIARIK